MKETISPTSQLFPATASTSPGGTGTAAIPARKEHSDAGVVFGKTPYKFWVISVLLLLAFWSMVTGTVTLKWSTGNLLSRLSDELDIPTHDDFDILEVEEREKVVKHMWDVYMHSKNRRLPRFWEEAFEAAYEALVSDAAAVRDGAVSEIAKMSLLSINFDPFSAVQSSNQHLETAKPARMSSDRGNGKKM
ncbi:unnamed protein product [Linum trigynum]|uniref:Sugar transporter n=1 Tax=Linum trigynum TaxID=586398 RepID=A0AAV2CJG4_9ROSI